MDDQTVKPLAWDELHAGRIVWGELFIDNTVELIPPRRGVIASDGLRKVFVRLDRLRPKEASTPLAWDDVERDCKYFLSKADAIRYTLQDTIPQIIKALEAELAAFP